MPERYLNCTCHAYIDYTYLLMMICFIFFSNLLLFNSMMCLRSAGKIDKNNIKDTIFVVF